MKKLYFSLLVILAFNQVDAKLNINIRNSELNQKNYSIEQVILKKGGDKIFLKNDLITFQRSYYNFNTKETYIFEKRLKNEGFNVPLNQLQDLVKGQQVIDKAPIYIETYFTDETKGKQMIFSNEMIEGLFKTLYTKYGSDMNEYFRQLPSGKYTFSSFINRRVKEKKSDFYKVIENELLIKGMVDEDIFNQPIIYIEKVQSTFDELNQLDENNVKSYEVLNNSDKLIALQGSSAKSGIIIIKLK